MDVLEYVKLKAPPEIAAALRDAKFAHGWWKAYCPRCDPDGRKRGKYTLRAGILTSGPRKGQPWWGCMRCQYQKEVAQDRRTEAIEWEVNRTKIAADEERIKRYALEVVESATFVRGDDPVDSYLRRTRFLAPLGTLWSTNLRVAHRRHTKHPVTKQAGAPVMIGVVRDVAGNVIAAHRTFLFELPDGRVVKISHGDVPRRFRHQYAKYSLATVHGAAIRLGIDSDAIGVAEGIESALGLSMAIGIPSWSTLSSGNMPNLVLPSHVRRVVIGPDLGDSKEAGMKACLELRRRVVEESKKRKVIISTEIALPRGRALDWADWAEHRARG